MTVVLKNSRRTAWHSSVSLLRLITHCVCIVWAHETRVDTLVSRMMRGQCCLLKLSSSCPLLMIVLTVLVTNRWHVVIESCCVSDRSSSHHLIRSSLWNICRMCLYLFHSFLLDLLDGFLLANSGLFYGTFDEDLLLSFYLRLLCRFLIPLQLLDVWLIFLGKCIMTLGRTVWRVILSYTDSVFHIGLWFLLLACRLRVHFDYDRSVVHLSICCLLLGYLLRIHLIRIADEHEHLLDDGRVQLTDLLSRCRHFRSHLSLVRHLPIVKQLSEEQVLELLELFGHVTVRIWLQRQ